MAHSSNNLYSPLQLRVPCWSSVMAFYENQYFCYKVITTALIIDIEKSKCVGCLQVFSPLWLQNSACHHKSRLWDSAFPWLPDTWRLYLESTVAFSLDGPLLLLYNQPHRAVHGTLPDYRVYQPYAFFVVVFFVFLQKKDLKL